MGKAIGQRSLILLVSNLFRTDVEENNNGKEQIQTVGTSLGQSNKTTRHDTIRWWRRWIVSSPQ